MAFDLSSFLGQSLAETFKDIVGQFKASPDKVLEMQEMLANNQSAIQQKQADLAIVAEQSLQNEVSAASANIQAEAKSGDKFTSRARPMFLYIVEAILFYNYIVVGLFGKVIMKYLGVGEIPLNADVLKLFGLCITGYTAFRSFDKFLGLPGDSSVKLGPLQIGNKN